MYGTMKLYKPPAVSQIQIKPEMRANTALIEATAGASVDKQFVELTIDDVIGSTGASEVTVSVVDDIPNAYWVAAHPDGEILGYCRL